MSWVAGLKKEVRGYFANRRKAKQNEQRIAAVQKRLPPKKTAPIVTSGPSEAMARANSMGMTHMNARQYSMLSAGDQTEIDRMLGKKKKRNAGEK